jgi:hypothetical protein
MCFPPQTFARLPSSAVVVVAAAANKKLRGWGGLEWHTLNDDTQRQQASKQAIADTMTQRYGYTVVPHRHLQAVVSTEGSRSRSQH